MKKFLTELVMIVFGVLFLLSAFGISDKGFKGGVLNQKEYVLILATLLIISAMGSIILQYLQNRKKIQDTTTQPTESEVEPKVKNHDQEKSDTLNNTPKIYISMILLVLFAYGFSYVGFFVTSFLFVFISTWMYSNWDKKVWKNYLLFSVVLNVVLYFLFDIVHVYFPDTLLF